MTSDAHAGLMAAIGATLPGASWQRCRTHYTINLMSITPKSAWPGQAPAMTRAHKLTGTTFSNSAQRGGCDATAKAALTLARAKRYLMSVCCVLKKGTARAKPYFFRRAPCGASACCCQEVDTAQPYDDGFADILL